MTPLQRGIDYILFLTLLSLSQLIPRVRSGQVLGEGRLKIGALPIVNQGEEEAEWAYLNIINYLRHARANVAGIQEASG